jgi:hypothetical protein
MATVTKPLHVSLVATLILISLAGAGCTTIGKQIGEPILIGQVQLQEGVTNVFQVIDVLGPPHHMSALPGGSVMVYEYINAVERQFGVNMDFLGLEWFKTSFGRAKAKRQVLLLLFDDDGFLRAQDYRDWTEDLGNGFGFQLFFVAVPTVDTRHLNAKPEQLSWGRAALEPLPVTLNTGQSLMSGSHGIEMRGTPDSVGQRSLEMKSTVRKKKTSE